MGVLTQQDLTCLPNVRLTLCGEFVKRESLQPESRLLVRKVKI